MKRFLPILCAFVLLLCGCGAQAQMQQGLFLQTLADPMDPDEALEDFEAMLDYAIHSDDLIYLKIYSVTLPPIREELIITEKEIIRSILTRLDKLEHDDPIRHEGNKTDLCYRIRLGFENGEVDLCSFSEKRIYIEYYGNEVEYHLPMCNPRAVRDIFVLIQSQIS